MSGSLRKKEHFPCQRDSQGKQEKLKPPDGRLDLFREADLDAVQRIERLSFKSPWGPVSFREELSAENAFGFVVRCASSPETDEVLAYIFFRVVLDEMQILRLAAAPDRRRRGLASRLLAKALETARQKGAEDAFLEVRRSNLAALSLYRKYGFGVVGKRPGYYPDNREDALILKKNLKEA